jgi:hypothetical protein
MWTVKWTLEWSNTPVFRCRRELVIYVMEGQDRMLQVWSASGNISGLTAPFNMSLRSFEPSRVTAGCMMVGAPVPSMDAEYILNTC